MKINSLREFIALWAMQGGSYQKILLLSHRGDAVCGALTSYVVWDNATLPNGDAVFTVDITLTPEALAYLEAGGEHA